MLTKTLVDGLERYHIGAKLRALRLKKKVGLVQLGQHTGLSPALLSKVERGRLFPTLPTLLRIALVFGVGLEHFFVTHEEPQPVIVRRKDRLKFPSHPGTKAPAYHFESLDYPVRFVSWLLPVTYGISSMQDIMLRGIAPDIPSSISRRPIE